MSLITTIYDASNACTIGTYHTYKGDTVKVEYMGTSAECLSMVEQLQQSEDDNEIVHVVNSVNVRCTTNEIVHIINRVNVRCTTPVHHSNPLFTAWAMPVGATC